MRLNTHLTMARLVVLNAHSLNAFSGNKYTLRIRRVSFAELPGLAAKYDGVIHYVRHQATMQLLNMYISLSPTSSIGLYQYSPGDALLVVVLKVPVRGQEVNSVSENDIELFLVTSSLNSQKTILKSISALKG